MAPRVCRRPFRSRGSSLLARRLEGRSCAGRFTAFGRDDRSSPFAGRGPRRSTARTPSRRAGAHASARTGGRRAGACSRNAARRARAAEGRETGRGRHAETDAEGKADTKTTADTEAGRGASPDGPSDETRRAASSPQPAGRRGISGSRVIREFGGLFRELARLGGGAYSAPQARCWAGPWNGRRLLHGGSRWPRRRREGQLELGVLGPRQLCPSDDLQFQSGPGPAERRAGEPLSLQHTGELPLARPTEGRARREKQKQSTWREFFSGLYIPEDWSAVSREPAGRHLGCAPRANPWLGGTGAMTIRKQARHSRGDRALAGYARTDRPCPRNSTN